MRATSLASSTLTAARTGCRKQDTQRCKSKEGTHTRTRRYERLRNDDDARPFRFVVTYCCFAQLYVHPKRFLQTSCRFEKTVMTGANTIQSTPLQLPVHTHQYSLIPPKPFNMLQRSPKCKGGRNSLVAWAKATSTTLASLGRRG